MLRPFSFWRELAVTCGGSGEGGHLPVPDLRDDIHCGGLGHIQFPSTPSLLSVFTTKGVELFWHQWRTLHSLMNLICSGCGPALLQAAPVNALSLPESNGLFSVFPSLDPQHQPGRLLPFSGVMPPGRHTSWLSYLTAVCSPVSLTSQYRSARLNPGGLRRQQERSWGEAARARSQSAGAVEV